MTKNDLQSLFVVIGLFVLTALWWLLRHPHVVEVCPSLYTINPVRPSFNQRLIVGRTMDDEVCRRDEQGRWTIVNAEQCADVLLRSTVGGGAHSELNYWKLVRELDNDGWSGVDRLMPRTLDGDTHGALNRIIDKLEREIAEWELPRAPSTLRSLIFNGLDSVKMELKGGTKCVESCNGSGGTVIFEGGPRRSSP